jgi:hypothetical protein
MKFILFVTYFPHLVAGPITHHREMMPQYAGAKPRLPGGHEEQGNGPTPVRRC